MSRLNVTNVGIDDISVYLPSCFVPIEELAIARRIDPQKLTAGLDLQAMAWPDINEDVATMASEAVWRIFQNNRLDPNNIGRIYIGTESGLDASKPIGSYVLGMLESILENDFGPRALSHCDVVDLTFACIGGVDALLNCVDWVRADTSRQAIVVATDWAKYELYSTGEYTQGAAAVAMLVKSSPRLLNIGQDVGVATADVHDFFKPRLSYDVEFSLEESKAEEVIDNLRGRSRSFYNYPDKTLKIYREAPVFDGQFSNQCYIDRANEALARFRKLRSIDKNESVLMSRWEKAIFHLPYAAHARRIGIDLIWQEMQQSESMLDWQLNIGPSPEESDFEDAKAFAKAKAQYMKSFAQEIDYQKVIEATLKDAQLVSMQVGNAYTASIFLALISAVCAAHNNNVDQTGKTYGFVAYGSGSKSKVFEGEVQSTWREVAEKIDVWEQIARRKPISMTDYREAHTGFIKEPLGDQTNRNFFLTRVDEQHVTPLPGVRHYRAGK